MERLKLPPRDFLLAMFEDRDGILIRRKTGKAAGSKRGKYLAVRATYNGERAQYYVHRVLWKMRTGEEPKYIDHRDEDTTNNRDGNLRAADASRNGGNRKGRTPVSGHKNVYVAGSGNYFAMVGVDRTFHRRPVTPVLAVAVADAEALRLEHFGEFANGGVSSNF